MRTEIAANGNGLPSALWQGDRQNFGSMEGAARRRLRLRTQTSALTKDHVRNNIGHSSPDSKKNYEQCQKTRSEAASIASELATISNDFDSVSDRLWQGEAGTEREIDRLNARRSAFAAVSAKLERNELSAAVALQKRLPDDITAAERLAGAWCEFRLGGTRPIQHG
jgi:hypothetical protein